MTAQPTDADLARAEALCTDMPGVDYEDDGTSWREKVRYVAQALADTRQPFLDLADQYARDPIIGRAVAAAIRAAATRGDQ
jgi:hypothetical protein